MPAPRSGQLPGAGAGCHGGASSTLGRGGGRSGAAGGLAAGRGRRGGGAARAGAARLRRHDGRADAPPGGEHAGSGLVGGGQRRGAGRVGGRRGLVRRGWLPAPGRQRVEPD
ncbi:hypothetical protein G6F22_016473 [Rhizopus arrhizus]|nr:hypothetical protein G6F22_016473 [Rhizopus arrhizus]